jgi:hypothetical protein
MSADTSDPQIFSFPRTFFFLRYSSFHHLVYYRTNFKIEHSLAIALSVPRFTASDNPFNIFKRFSLCNLRLKYKTESARKPNMHIVKI